MQQELEQLRSEQAERERLIADTAKLQKEIEALRAECAEHARRAQEASRLQHELQMLRSENAELKMSTSIGSPPPPPTRMSMGLSRSASVTGSPGLRKNRPQLLARSNTIKQGESRQVLSERGSGTSRRSAMPCTAPSRACWSGRGPRTARMLSASGSSRWSATDCCRRLPRRRATSTR